MTAAPLFDTHCHLDDPRLAAEIDDVIARARDAGVVRIVTIGCAREPSMMERALEVARRDTSFLRATVGVHPHDAKHLDDATFLAMERTASDPLVVAIGETGLDYHYDNSPRPAQLEAFRRQIALARAVKKPIVVHTREAPEDTLRILREEGARDVGGIIHCFSEDAAFAEAALDLGFVASFSGIVTFKNATGVRDAAAKQPLDALLVETDAPYLAPVPHRGKRNEPAFVRHTAQAIAELRGADVESVCRASTENASRLFAWPL